MGFVEEEMDEAMTDEPSGLDDDVMDLTTLDEIIREVLAVPLEGATAAALFRVVDELADEIRCLHEKLAAECEITKDLGEIANRRSKALTIVTAARDRLREDNERLQLEYASALEQWRDGIKETRKLYGADGKDEETEEYIAKLEKVAEAARKLGLCFPGAEMESQPSKKSAACAKN